LISPHTRLMDAAQLWSIASAVSLPVLLDWMPVST
jgi:hypothetical protein